MTWDGVVVGVAAGVGVLAVGLVAGWWVNARLRRGTTIERPSLQPMSREHRRYVTALEAQNVVLTGRVERLTDALLILCSDMKGDGEGDDVVSAPSEAAVDLAVKILASSEPPEEGKP